MLNSISRFLRGSDIDETLVEKCGQIADQYQDRQTDAIRDGVKKYPRGWTGKIGIWKNYFSSKNQKAYYAVVSDFIRHYPGASALLKIYPSLLSGVKDIE